MMRPQEIVAAALAEAGGDELAVMVQCSSQVNLRWADNSLTTNGDVHGVEIDIVAFHTGAAGTGTATVSGQARDRAALAALVERARAAARAAAPAEDTAPLPEAGESRDWDDDCPTTAPTALTDLAGRLGETFRRGRGDGVHHFGYAENDVTTTFLGTSAGTRLRHTQISNRLELTAKSTDRARSAWHGVAGTPLPEVDVAAADEMLRQRLSWQTRRLDIPPGRHPVMLSPSAVADLMVDLYWSADAQSAAEGRSVFSRPGGGVRVGEHLGGDLTLSSDPLPDDPTMACTPFVTAAASSAMSSPFDNGIPLQPTSWIAGGRLQHLVTTRFTAAMAGLPDTPAIDNLRLQTATGDGTAADMIGRMDDGLVVTCLWYNRLVDPQTLLLTGLTRDGVYVVRGGEVVGACGNFRFNESPVGLLGRIVDSGAPERTLAREMGDYFNRATMPPLLVADFNMSTASEAM